MVQAAGLRATLQGEIQRDGTVVARNRSRRNPYRVKLRAVISRLQRLQIATHILRVRSEKAGDDLMCCCRASKRFQHTIRRTSKDHHAAGIWLHVLLRTAQIFGLCHPQDGWREDPVHPHGWRNIRHFSPSLSYRSCRIRHTFKAPPISSDMSHPLRMIRTPHKARHKCLVEWTNGRSPGGPA